MNTSMIEYWTMCITCDWKRHRRISPSDPSTVVQHDESSNKQSSIECNNSAEEPGGTISSRNNGEINHHFVPEDEVVLPSRGDDEDDIDCTSRHTHTPKLFENLKNKSQLITTVFIETGKDKQLRVVHFKAKDIILDVNDMKSENSSSLPDEIIDSDSEEDEEDEKYWFSRWSRKPRLKSIFEKSTISSNNNIIERDLESTIEFRSSRDENCVIPEEDGELVQDSMDSIRWSIHNTKESNSNSRNNESLPKVQDMEEIGQTEEQGYTNMGFQHGEEIGHKVDDEDETDVNKTKSQDAVPVSASVLLNPPTEILKDDIPSSLFAITPTEINPTQRNSAEDNNINIDNVVVSKSNISISNPPTKPVLFFIHGISGSSDLWKSQTDFFQKLGFEMVVPDLLGHGLSSTPYQAKHYLFESLVQDLICVFDYFIREETKTVIIGHGYGACLATVLSRVRPKNVVLLISISGGGPTPLVRPICCQTSWIPFHCRFFHTNKRKGRFDNPDLINVLPKIVHYNMLLGQVWEDGDSAFHRRISVPTLLVYGMRDKVVNLVEECEMERTIPRAFLELISTAGHMVMWDEPQKLNKMLAKFIQSWN